MQNNSAVSMNHLTHQMGKSAWASTSTEILDPVTTSSTQCDRFGVPNTKLSSGTTMIRSVGVEDELLSQAHLFRLQAPGSHEGQQDYRRIYRKVRRGVLRQEGEAVFVLLLMFTLRGEPMTLEIPQPDYQT